MYRFKSKAAGDVLMLGPQGDQLLRLIGREPSPRGIVEPAVMPAAIEALVAAAEDDALRRARAPDPADGDEQAGGAASITVRQRVWPFVELLRRSHAADEPVVWGV
jgi:hypothetical protein